MAFDVHLRNAGVDEAIIAQIMSVEYCRDEGNAKQNEANFMAAALRKSEELLDDDMLSEVMFDRACCKTGYRLANSRAFAKEHKDKPLEEKLALLHDVKNMGHPFLNADGDIESVAVFWRGVQGVKCPCWQINGNQPVDGPMPLAYCRCCAGHFRFHYQKALGLKLRLKQVKSSLLNSEGKEPCVFVYEIL